MAFIRNLIGAVEEIRDSPPEFAATVNAFLAEHFPASGYSLPLPEKTIGPNSFFRCETWAIVSVRGSQEAGAFAFTVRCPWTRNIS